MEFNHLQKSQKIEHIKQEPMYTLDTARQAFGVAATENEMLHSNGSMFLSAALQQANQDGESDSGNSQDSDHEPGWVIKPKIFRSSEVILVPMTYGPPFKMVRPILNSPAHTK